MAYKELSLRSGIRIGESVSEQTILDQTVAMEHHPCFHKTIDDLKLSGYKFIYHLATYAQVEMELIATKNTLCVNKSILVVENMRWLDLLHELIHVDQIEAMITRGFLLFTSVDVSRDHSSLSKRELKLWQNDIFEFHARLIEFSRLYHNCSDTKVVLEHAAALPRYSKKFWRRGAKIWKSESRYAWIKTYFPDIFDLRDEVELILMSEFRLSLFDVHG